MPLFPLNTGGGGGPVPPISDLLDDISSVRGSVLYRGAAAWQALAPGTTGYQLTSAGAGADPFWTPAGTSGGGGGGGTGVYSAGTSVVGNLAMFANTAGTLIEDADILAEKVVRGPGPPTSGTPLTYSSVGDTNGIVYYLGTNALTLPFSNPNVSGIVTVLRSSNDSGTPSDLTGRVGGLNTHTSSIAGSWVGIDLGYGRAVVPNNYVLINRGQFGSGNYPRTWKFQGTNNIVSNTVANWEAAAWTDLDTRVLDTQLNGDNAGAVYNVVTAVGYRYFRWYQNGPDSGGSNYFTVGQIEIYGNYSTAAGSLDNAIVRWHEATGQYVQDSGSTLSDTGDVVFPGSLKATAITLAAQIITGNLTIDLQEYTVLANTASGNINVTLPASPVNGRIINIKKISASNTLTIVRNGNNIDGVSANLSITTDNQNTQLQFVTGFGWATL